MKQIFNVIGQNCKLSIKLQQIVIKLHSSITCSLSLPNTAEEDHR